MNKKRFVFTIEGLEQNNRHLELSVFAEKVKQFRDFLKISADESGKNDIAFNVVGLSHSSPATIECEPAGKNMANNVAAFESVRKNLNLVENRQTRNLSHRTLYAMEDLAEFNPQKIARAEIQLISEDDKEECVYKLDEGFREKLNEARSSEEKIVSTIDGKLEKINIHNNANTFTIYTFVSSVVCKFPKDLLGEVQSALGSFVSVWGECSYRPDAAFPYKISVREMKVLPPGEEVPSLRDLYGIAPDATGGKSSEQFVREMRDEWGKKEQ